MSKKNKEQFYPRTRREFLNDGVKGCGLISMASFAPNFLVDSALAETPKAEKDRRILVIIQMAGGNDGLNTVIPFDDDGYYERRPNLALKEYNKIGDYHGLNKAMPELYQMFEEGNAAVINHVGYPNPNRSHFRSTDIYELGGFAGRTGWAGRFLDAACPDVASQKDPIAVNMGKSIPMTFRSVRTHNVYSKIGADDALMETAAVKKSMLADKQTQDLLKASIQRTEKLDNTTLSYLGASFMDSLVTKERMDGIMNAYIPQVDYKGGGLGQSLKNIAALIAHGMPTRVYYAKIGGFDTHANQKGRHDRLISTLSAAVDSFYKDLQAKKLDEQVLTMTFSEFGRRIEENGSAGTDHGTMTPMFVMGPAVKGGYYANEEPIHLAECGGDLPWDTKKCIDFRQVYSTIIERWMETDPSKIFDKKYYPLDFV